MDLENIKQELLKEKEETEKFLQQLDEEVEKLKASDEFEISDLSEQFEEKQEFHIKKEILTKKLESINKALARIEKGTYGICTKCGQSIPEARLKIDPLAEFCLKCSQKE